jgi:hypothetical protein
LNLANIILCWVMALLLCSVIGPAVGHAKDKAQSNRHAINKAAKKHASVFDGDGYRLVSPNSTMRCAQTLRGTLDCKE